jgi:AraC-like DNA-binding protein
MSRGRARLAISHGLSVWLLEAPDGFGDADFHSHHALQITAALSGSLSLTCSDMSLSGSPLAVAADARHKFEAHGILVFIFVEPESRMGRELTQALFSESPLVPLGADVQCSLEPLRSSFDEKTSDEVLLRAGRSAIEALIPTAAAPTPDARILKIIDYAASHLDGPLTLAEASQGIYVSPSRLRHLFVEQTGLPFKTYLLWLRLMRAVQIYSQGRSLTEAAHQAGFSDSPHFSRIFRRTFGLPATTLTRI